MILQVLELNKSDNKNMLQLQNFEKLLIASTR